MRILFDAFWWVNGPGANRTVMREMILGWHREFPEDELILALRSGDLDQADDLPDGVATVTTRLWPQMVANGVELPRLARRVKADVVVAHNYAPMTGPSVVFVHDLLFLEHWDWFTTAERAYFTPMSWTQRRATVIATSSKTEADRMERLVPALKPVHPVGLAVATELANSASTRPTDTPDGPFSLIVGRLNVRKNLEKAITAAGQAKQVSPDQPLLIVGDSAHSGRSLGLPDSIKPLVDEGSVRFLGRISDGELRWLYEHCALTMYLSLDEGFGLPPVEAASFGSPLLVSDIPLFHETVGGVARFADPNNVAEIASAIDDTFDPLRSTAVRAREAVAAYTWEHTVHELRTLAVAVSEGTTA